MDTMRMESGFLHWGHDISPEENQYQAGLNFTISYKKPFNFIGKEKLLEIKNQKIDRRFVMLTLKESKPGKPLLLHEEPIYLESKLSAKQLLEIILLILIKIYHLDILNSNLSNEQLSIEKKNLYIEVEKQKYQAQLIAKPLNTEGAFKNI